MIFFVFNMLSEDKTIKFFDCPLNGLSVSLKEMVFQDINFYFYPILYHQCRFLKDKIPLPLREGNLKKTALTVSLQKQ